MTDAELRRMRRLYEKGMIAKNIASEIGYSQGYVEEVIRKNRDKFPYRRAHVSKSVRDECVSLVMNDDWTMVAAAHKYGVHVNTVSRWVKARIRSDQKKARRCRSQAG